MQNLFILKCNNIFKLTYRLSSSSSSSIKPTLISRIRYILNHYWLGSKLLYHNYKSVQLIKKKDINSLTRNDKLSLDQFGYDIRVGIPFVMLFAMPIIGYTAPLLALIAPKYLPSTLIMPTQKIKFLEDDANTSKSIIDSFVQFTKTQYNHQTIYGAISFMQFIEQVSNSDDRFNAIMSSIPSYSSLFNRNLYLSIYPREHLLILHKSVLHSSYISRYFLSNYSLENQLEFWQNRILIDDKQIKTIKNFTPYELVLSLYNRGIYFHINEMGKVLEYEQTKNLNNTNKKLKKSNDFIEIDKQILNDWNILLHQWIEIHNKLSKYNPISTSFLLHITPLLVKQ